MDTKIKNYSRFNPKIFLIFVLCLLVRLIPFRAPNVEPILSSAMPISKKNGAFIAFLFAVLSIVLYDLLTGTIGMQTFFTAGAYGIIGLWSARYFQKREATPFEFVRFAIWGTLLYDALTGLTVGPIFFHQSFFSSLAGQIPFTMLHLLGNITFAFVLSPVIYNFLIKKKKIKTVSTINTFHPKTI